MTQKSVDAVLQKAAKDAKCRKQLAAEPDKALTPYRDQLSEDEIDELKSISPELLNSISRINRVGPSRKWYLPGSFKEFGGALVSIVLLLLILFVIWQTFGVICESGRSSRAVFTTRRPAGGGTRR